MELLSHIKHIVTVAGLAQIALVLGSVFIPHILKWKAALNGVQPLIKKLFWTYAVYILCINLSFGLLSALAAPDLVNGTKLATLVSAFITIYWLSRVLVQFFYFDRSSFPTGWLYILGEVALVCLFIMLTLTYGLAFYLNVNQL
ncbi:hypothetical protein [Mucilaginibacter terrae]|uniref:DUF4149 domain-containing protein n=1 Tax=Mucilaginibacter terrae TaxID=1955052 RepID=A0ABU3H0Q3_9SPHI|nr:hypothetical protein [Mucilaginibacter terrae]MDT3405603.1 hypothetical protein [Mucilaginibacter terrae]